MILTLREGVVLMTDQQVDRMPGKLKLALVGVWLQAIANPVAGIFLLTLTNDRLDHGQEVPYLTLVRSLAYISILVGAVLIVCGVLAPRRLRWVRATVLAVEGLSALGTLLAFVTGGDASSVVGLVLPALIASVLLGPAGRDWFTR